MILALVTAVYVFYYIYILKAIGKTTARARNLTNPSLKTRITLVIPTYNEELAIGGKLLNLIEQTYPLNLMEVIVIDSNSSDKTVKIVKKFMLEHPELDIKLIEEDKRLGKSTAVNKAFSSARPQSEVIMMTDVDVYLEKDAIEKVVSNFGDPTVGAVCGRQVLMNPQESKETKMEATYQRFYEKLRIGESVIDSTPLFEGQFAAYRANVIQGENVRENANADDCQLAITVRRKGFKAMYDQQAVFYEYSPPDRASLQLQKVRRGQGLARLFWQSKDMMFKNKYGKFGLIILPANFFMHIISPFLVFSVLILCFASFSCYLLQCRDLTWVAVSSMLAGVILAIGYFASGKKYLSITWTFLEYQLILLRGILLILRRRSLHKWQKVDIIREKYIQKSRPQCSTSYT